MQTILAMSDENPVKMIFLHKLDNFINHRHRNNDLNDSVSPIYEILRVAESFSLLDTVVEYANFKTWPPKSYWSKLFWARAWELDDQLCRANQCITKNTDLLKQICGNSMYLSWWFLSDSRPKLIRICKILVKIVSEN